MASTSSTARSNSRPTEQKFQDRSSKGDRISSPLISKVIGVESNSTEAEGDTWDDDFEDVKEVVFEPSTFPANEDSADEEADEEEGEEDESTITTHVYLKGNEASEGNAEAGDRAIKSVERADDDTNGDDDGEDDEMQEQEGEEGSSMEARRMMRSMSPSPQPPPVHN
ncbi:hypothetical protein DL95DRAFT_462152 [Leptodontidium sp. 2 PMI_412]|nr:hypothetical protein DL95DRAFT_462152 [Leptodontidium sp. 2 PMI_412]